MGLCRLFFSLSIFFCLFVFGVAFLFHFQERGEERRERKLGRSEEEERECFQTTIAFPDPLLVQKTSSSSFSLSSSSFLRYPDDFLEECSSEIKREKVFGAREEEEEKEEKEEEISSNERERGREKEICVCKPGEGWCADGINPHLSFIPIPISICDGAKERFSLEENGFEVVQFNGMKDILSQINEHGALLSSFKTAIQTALTFQIVKMKNGALMPLYASSDGMLLRTTSPSPRTLELEPHFRPLVSKTVHADQDIRGEPLNTLAFGMAPLLFHPLSPLRLVNIWFPVQMQKSRPLVFMDLKTLESDEQLRYHILNPYLRDQLGAIILNDCWTFLHSSSQQWFWDSSLAPSQGYIFNTFQTPHTSCELPCESLLSNLFLELRKATKISCKAIKNATEMISSSLNTFKQTCTLVEQEQLEEALALAEQGSQACSSSPLLPDELLSSIDQLEISLSRSSVEMRVVVIDLEQTILLLGLAISAGVLTYSLFQSKLI